MMKKRIISLLLAVIMVAAMFTCMGTSAFADDTFTYTIKKGDTLWGLCNAKGLNYYTCKNAIMTLNGFKDEYKLSHLSVGDTITLPISDAVAQTLAANSSTTTNTTTTTSGSVTTTTTTTTGTLANGDVVSYYLASHTMAKGETVQGIYNAWGLSYKTYSDQILAVNGLKGFNKMYAGKAYLFPVPTVPSGSTAAYSVIAHKVVSKDSAYNLCNTYNTNYNKSVTVIKALNGGSDLTKIKTGQIVYIPATGNVTPSGGTSGTVTPGTSGGSTVIGATAYELKKTAAKNGSFITKIGSSEVTTAKSGQSVVIVTSPAAGYVVDSIVVSKADDAYTTVATNSSVFTMPAYAVNVKVTFKLASTVTSGAAHKINVSASNGTVKAICDGAEVTTAKAGSFISVQATPNRGYALDSVQVSYNNYASKVPVSSNAFNMPDYDVNVVVTFKALASYDISWVYNANNGPGCNYTTQVNGVTAKKALAGDTVTVVPVPASGYAVSEVNVTYVSGKAVSMTNAYSFVMPAEPVLVEVIFAGSYSISTTVSNGSVKYKVDGVDVNKAVDGKTVTIVPTPNSGYVIKSVEVLNGSTAVTATANGDNTEWTFTMPKANVTVKVTMEKVKTYALTADPAGSLKFMVNNGYVTSAAAGETVKVVAGTLAAGKKLGVISSADLTGDSAINTTDNTFKMPAKAVTVAANLDSIAERTISVNFDAHVSKLTLTVDGKTVAPASTSSVQNTYKVLEGKNVTIEALCEDGYAVDSITSPQVAISNADIFTVGATDAVINVASRGQYRSIMSSTPGNGSFTLVNAYGNTITNTAAAGETIYIKPSPDKNYVVDKISYSYLVNGSPVTKDCPLASDNTYGFLMPGADVTLNVSFKASERNIKTLTLDTTNAASITGASLRIDVGGAKYATGDINVMVKSGTTVTVMPALTSFGYSVSDVQIMATVGGVAQSIKDKVSFTDNGDGTYSFKMPADYTDLVITVVVVVDAH